MFICFPLFDLSYIKSVLILTQNNGEDTNLIFPFLHMCDCMEEKSLDVLHIIILMTEMGLKSSGI